MGRERAGNAPGTVRGPTRLGWRGRGRTGRGQTGQPQGLHSFPSELRREPWGAEIPALTGFQLNRRALAGLSRLKGGQEEEEGGGRKEEEEC